MLNQIITFLLDVATGVLGGACLLRLYMQYLRIPFGNPVGRLVFALSDWLVLPLRRVVPAVGRWDMASLVAVLLLELAQYGLLWLLFGGRGSLVVIPVLAVFGLLRLVVSGLVGLVIAFAVLSWVQAGSPIFQILERLCEPALRPVRRWLPLVKGVDLSPLVLLVLLQVVLMVIGHLQVRALTGF